MAKSKGKSKKRDNSKVIEEVISDDTNLVDKLLIAGGVLLFIVAFYVLTVYITNKNTDSSEKETEKTVEVSNKKIVLGSSLSMSSDEYYVVYYTSDNSTMTEIVNAYNKELPLYNVDMSSAFNKKYATDGESNKNPTKASEFLINGPTLIKVSNKQVVEYIEGEDEIRTILN